MSYFDEVKTAMAFAKAIPRPKFDCVVLLDHQSIQLKQHVEDDPAEQPPPTFGMRYALTGLPVYRAGSEAERTGLVAELIEQGKRPMIAE